jgi:hypothetical protein
MTPCMHPSSGCFHWLQLWGWKVSTIYWSICYRLTFVSTTSGPKILYKIRLDVITQLPHPRVFKCTWNTACELFLGASQGGYYWDKPVRGAWRHALKHARFRLLDNEPFKLAGWGYQYSPAMLRNGQRKGSKFGACAETYPFLALLMYFFPY